jgi:S1-C subfamily serine protease
MMKKTLLIVGVALLFGIIGYEVSEYKQSHRPDISQTRVEADYVKQFRATCAVVNSKSTNVPPRSGGTGVLLNTGYILTAQHVVDSNNNGKIDGKERIVKLVFYYPKYKEIKGEVVLINNKPLRLNGKMADFAVIKPEEDIKSEIRLISRDNYELFGVGKPIFTVGRMNGDFPHLTVGNKSYPIGENNVDRGNLDIWHGNSGGGVYSKDTGELIGLCSTIRKRGGWGGGFPIPGWMEYCDANQVRGYLEVSGDTKYINAPYEPLLTVKSKMLILFGAITLFGAGYAFRENISAVLRKLRRTNA